jgi:molybdenum cofactor cytidylyltransferase
MGTFKPLLDWGGTTLVEYQLGQLNAAPVDRVVAILGHRADELLPLVHKAGASALVNELYPEGRASSLRVGAAALGEDTEAIVIMNVDQPRPRRIIARLIEEHRRLGELITIPVYGGKRGHPPVLAGALLHDLRQAREATQGLRAIVQAHQTHVREVPFDTPLVLLDMNRPGDYERAKTSYFQQVAS